MTSMDLFNSKTSEAETLSASCPKCGADCNVHAQFRQATRQRPMEFLGFGAYCMNAESGCFAPMGGGSYFEPTSLQRKLIAA
jgi:hypothetical protein